MSATNHLVPKLLLTSLFFYSFGSRNRIAFNKPVYTGIFLATQWTELLDGIDLDIARGLFRSKVFAWRVNKKCSSERVDISEKD